MLPDVSRKKSYKFAEETAANEKCPAIDRENFVSSSEFKGVTASGKYNLE